MSVRRSGLLLWASVVAAAGVLACGKPKQQMMMQMEPDVPFDGGTIGGTIPLPTEVPEPSEGDAGLVVGNQTCCLMNLSIPDQEPANATGRVVGNTAMLRFDGGLELKRGGGTWSAQACLPVGEQVLYAYEFTWPFDAGSSDGGGLDAGPGVDAGADDAGTDAGADLDAGFDAGPSSVVVVRSNPNEPRFADGQGGWLNSFGPYSSCSAADASVGSWP